MTPPLSITPDSVLLFQGDSITDAGRDRFTIRPNNQHGLGFGYPRLIAEQILTANPGREPQIYNRGISGDRIRDMARRWDKDCTRLAPDLLSVLIGVNDTWNYIFMGMGSSPAEYHQIFRELLLETRHSLPEIHFVLCEPFVLITGEVTDEWVDDIQQRQRSVRDLAEEFQGIFVPFQSALDKAEKKVPAHRLLDDGVHPTEQGHRLLADCWLNTVFGFNI
jgi:lysophospholipase L1-like esterase